MFGGGRRAEKYQLEINKRLCEWLVPAPLRHWGQDVVSEEQEKIAEVDDSPRGR